MKSFQNNQVPFYERTIEQINLHQNNSKQCLSNQFYHKSSYSLGTAPSEKEVGSSSSSSQVSPNEQIQMHFSTSNNSSDNMHRIDRHTSQNQEEIESFSYNQAPNDANDKEYIQYKENVCPDVEDFQEYIHEFSRMNLPSKVLQNDENQERLFGGKTGFVPHYAYTIVQNITFLQSKYPVNEVKDSRELQLRENLIDLMSTMHSILKLSNESFYLGSNIFARFLNNESTTDLPQNYLIVLVGTCLFIASKYEEIYPPSLSDFVELVAQYSLEGESEENRVLSQAAMSKYNKTIIECEGEILIKLQFSLFGPTRLQFFESFLSQAQLDPSQESFCLYLLELSQLNHSLYKYSHSQIAASTILLSEKFKNISGRYFWSTELELITNFCQPDLYVCVEDLYSYLVTVTNSKRRLNIYQKYSDSKLKGVSLIDYDLSHNINSSEHQKQNQQNQQIDTYSNHSMQSFSESVQHQQPIVHKSSRQSQQMQKINSNKHVEQPSEEIIFYFNQGSISSSSIRHLPVSQQIQSSSFSIQMSEQQSCTISSDVESTCDYQNYSEASLSQPIVSKAKSECLKRYYNNNTENENSPANQFTSFSEIRQCPPPPQAQQMQMISNCSQTMKQYDITRYLQKIKPAYKNK